ncbi:MAG: DUF5692 family protein [Treponema sp.]|nr:DUF5692 family protein [Spirochaetia bacterium]MDY2840858.1 DUF5692 family protein [Treponema sp.]MDY5123238.1 DUF5692 family protein [Treponema sp.]
MLFQLYGANAGTQLIGWVLVFAALVLMNEIGRRTKAGGIALFIVLPLALTVYFIAVAVGAASGAAWAKNNQTYLYMNGWFHYAKLYAADIGCVGFMILKYKWGKLGKSHWFKAYPFVIVAINILIAVGSDFESAIKAGSLAGGWWKSTENVWLYGGWWNVVNGIAGILNILCMTGWFGIYSSKDKNKQDMLWPDMTIWFIIAYDLWNFQYTYANLPTHTWYCGVALLLAPTFAAAFWNKGGWIQNRANTLALWCMFAQVFPLFQISGKFATLPSLYQGATEAGIDAFAMTQINTVEELTAAGITANPKAQAVVAVMALIANVCVLAAIVKRSVKAKKNPYTNEIWTGTRDFEEAMARAE